MEAAGAIPPRLDDPSRRSQRREHGSVQTRVAQATIERLHKAVLLRLTLRGVIPLDPGILAPGGNGMTGQFGAGVAKHHARQSATFGDDAQLTNDPPTGQRGVNDPRQTLSAIVGDVEQAESPIAGQRVRHEVERPALVGLCRIATSARVPSARLRPPRLRTVSRSS